MWPAVDLDTILDRARAVTPKEDPLGERLISLLFASPRSRVWEDLRFTKSHLDPRTGTAWDLFVIGVPSVARTEAPRAGGNWVDFLDARRFDEMAAQVRQHHRTALIAAGKIATPPWKYRGVTELVNLMAYDGELDWLSLRSVRIDERGLDLDLFELSDRMVDWKDGSIDGELSPGLGPGAGGPTVRTLGSALAYSVATAVAGGVLGNAVYDMLGSLGGH